MNLKEHWDGIGSALYLFIGAIILISWVFALVKITFFIMDFYDGLFMKYFALIVGVVVTLTSFMAFYELYLHTYYKIFGLKEKLKNE